MVLEISQRSILEGDVFERLYLSPTTGTDAKTMNHLHRALIDLYSTVLSAMAQCIRLFEIGDAKRALRATISPNLFPSLINTLESKGRAVKSVADICERIRVESRHIDVLGELQGLRDILQRALVRQDGQLSDLWARDLEKDRGDILRWISAIPYEDDHAHARKYRLLGTGEWLLREPKYRE